MKINKDKTVLGAKEIEILGFIISQDSIKPKDEYLKKLASWRTPSSVTELRKFLGKVGHISQSYPGIEKKLRILYPLLKKSSSRFNWKESHEEAFLQMKELIMSPITLTGIKPDVDLTMISDAGEQGFAVKLLQQDRHIGHIARRYSPTSIALLSPPLREAYAIKEALLYFQPFILGHHVHCLTDSKVSVQLSQKLEDRNKKFMSRIMAEIEVFDISLEHVKRTDLRIKSVDSMGRLDEGYVSS